MALWTSLAGNGRRSRYLFPRPLVDGWEGRRLLIRSCLFAVVCGALFALEASGGFSAAPTYAAVSKPFNLVVGDFNNDGLPDLAMTGLDRNGKAAVAILLGNGDGSFQAPLSYEIDYGFAIALGDFNGDGHVDIVTSSGFILLGNGDGTFQAPQSYGAQGSSLAVADFNGDGKLDLALATGENAVSILLGNGDGTFQSAVSYNAGNSPSSLVVGDFNGDGIPDLAVANGPEGADRYTQVSVALGRGDGTFGTFYSYAPGLFTFTLAVGDFNGDGIQDLILATGFGLYIMLANGDGTFLAPRFIPGRAWPFVAAFVAIGDFNGDGHLDLAELAAWGVSIQLGNGDGTFQDAPASYAAAASLTSLAVGDFNRDGHLDIAVAGDLSAVAGGTISILMNNSDGTLRAARAFPDGAGSQSVVVGDLNGDGKLDVVTANFVYSFTGRPLFEWNIIESDVEVFLGNGDGTFQAAHTYKTGGAPLAVALADFNGDGIPDLAVANGGIEDYLAPPDRTVGILLGNGDGTFQPAQTYAVGPAPFALAVGDFNGDGRLDIAVAEPSGVSILLGNGDGTFQAAQTYPAQVGSLVVGDFNRDGKLDIATSGGSLLLGNGSRYAWYLARQRGWHVPGCAKLRSGIAAPIGDCVRLQPRWHS